MRPARAIVVVLAALAAPAAASTMQAIPGGSTRIGNDAGRPDERPAFSADVEPFALDRAPVTVRDFAAFVAATGWRTQAERFGSGAVMTFGTGRWQLVAGASWHRPLGPRGAPAADDHPVTQVSWHDAHAYCAAAGKRLPTEIEFEHAARLGGAGTEPRRAGRYRANVWTGAFPALNTAADGYRTTSPVGAFGADALGLHDMAGNVWEWTQDWYRPYARRHEPWPADRPGEKVQRGGSFLCDPNLCQGFRPSARGHAAPDSAHMHVGFRCARSAPARVSTAN